MTGAPESFQPRITARHQRSPRFFCRRSSGQGDLADAAGDNQPAIEVHFKIETDVYAAKLEETATEGTAGKSGWSEFRKETTAPNQNFPGSRADHSNFVRAVFGTNDKPLHVLPGLELNALRPVMGGPRVKQCACGTTYLCIHKFSLLPWATSFQTLSTIVIVISSVCDRPTVKF